MRDIAVTLAVFGSLPFILARPWIGILVWTWLGFMNPHRLAWGFSVDLPFAMIVALTTLVGMFFSHEPKRLSRQPEMFLMLAFLAWMLLTTLNAFYRSLAWEQFDKVLKVFFMIFVASMLINTKQRLVALVTVIALSIGFFGVKGGIFTILTGGAFHVRGPERSFIGGNNEIGLALCMTVPLLYYLRQIAPHPMLRLAALGAVLLTVVAALGTQSRGALLGLVAMGTFLWLKSRQKLQIGLLIVFAVVVLVPLMPESWVERMQSIRRYDEDASASSRLNAWGMAFNLASARLFGGGFETFQPDVFYKYAPSTAYFADAHSIFFEVLGEHGFPGLAIFLMIAGFSWFSASGVIRRCKGDTEHQWLGDLMAMTQVSLVAYLTAGAFLGLAYFDYFYNLVLIVAIAKGLVASHRRSGTPEVLHAGSVSGRGSMRSPAASPSAAISEHAAVRGRWRGTGPGGS
jgi:probable O-glycosylation ligase (exosortase A-associated)